MQRLPKQIAATALGATTADIYSAPKNTKTTISACSVTNKSAAASTVTVTIKPADGEARYVAFNLGVGVGKTVVIGGALAQTLEAGDVLAAFSDTANALDIVVSAYETNP